MGKIKLELPVIANNIREFDFPEVDFVLGVATGGIVPASLVSFALDKPFGLIKINYRDENNQPKFSEPQVFMMSEIGENIQKILLVDDVSVSGKTLEVAKKYLNNYDIKSFVLKGKADYVLFPEIKSCVEWPWKIE